ncbi:MAG: PAS domain-containing protein, partial [Lachnospiraceae bacterium]|nr:PAS domain-containing protein [Lachnospiraceae bacterium]
MFGKKQVTKTQEQDNRVAELEARIRELKDQLYDSKEELEAVNTSTHLGIWKCFYDNEGNQQAVEYSDEFRRMLGYSKEEFPDSVDTLGGLIHPDDVAAVFANFGEAAADRSGIKKYDIDYRLLAKDGQYRWFHAAGECLRWP